MSLRLGLRSRLRQCGVVLIFALPRPYPSSPASRDSGTAWATIFRAWRRSCRRVWKTFMASGCIC